MIQKTLIWRLVSALFFVLSSFAFAAGPATAPAWKLVWSDEFDGSAIDRAKWTFDKGNGFLQTDSNTWIAGWGNNELQYYTDRVENAFVKDGLLHIRAVKEVYERAPYTSARMITKGLFEKTYGRFEFRARLPLGRGLWPALWLLPADNAYGIWASSGEIDIMEARGQEPSKVLGTIHFGSRWPANAYSGGEFTFPDRGGIGDFHVYALEWEPGVMRWYVDDKLYSTKRWWWSSSKVNAQRQGVKPQKPDELNPWPAPFDKKFYIVMNLAVGGGFLGNPDASTPFPSEMLIDYVRVYDKAYAPPAQPDPAQRKLPFDPPAPSSR